MRGKANWMKKIGSLLLSTVVLFQCGAFVVPESYAAFQVAESEEETVAESCANEACTCDSCECEECACTGTIWDQVDEEAAEEMEQIGFLDKSLETIVFYNEDGDAFEVSAPECPDYLLLEVAYPDWNGDTLLYMVNSFDDAFCEAVLDYYFYLEAYYITSAASVGNLYATVVQDESVFLYRDLGVATDAKYVAGSDLSGEYVVVDFCYEESLFGWFVQLVPDDNWPVSTEYAWISMSSLASLSDTSSAEPDEPENACGCCEDCTGDESCTCECEGCTCVEQEPDEPEIPSVDAPVTDSEGNELTDSEGNPIIVTVSGEALPDGAQVVATVPTVNGELLEGVYDIKVLVDGVEWQPIDEGKTVTVTIPVKGVEDGRCVDVYHFIDYASALNDDVQYFSTEDMHEYLLCQLEDSIDISEQEACVPVEALCCVQVMNGVAKIETDSFSVYYYSGGSYGGSDGNDSDYINFESGNIDNGKTYFVTRGTVIYCTKGLSATNSWVYDDVFSKENVGYTAQMVIFTVSNSAEIYGKYKVGLETWVGSTTSEIYFVVMPELTITFESNITADGVNVTLPDPISGIFMGNCSANEHDPDNGKYGALNYTLPVPTVSSQGYEFTHWYVKHEPTRTFNGGTEISLSNDTLQVNWDENTAAYEVTLVAAFTIDDYTITYVNDGESSTKSYTITDTITIPKPTKGGFTFAGWSVSSEDDVQNWTSKYAIIPGGSTLSQMYGNVTLEATWVANGDTPYTVYHHFQNVSQSGYEISLDVDTLYGTTDESTNAALAQRIVVGFEVEEIGSATISGDGTTEVIIKYKRVTTTITFDTLGGTAIDAISGVYGAPVAAPADPTKEHYTFMGWYTADAPDVLYSFSTMPAEDLTLYAKWQIKKVTITFYDDDGITVLYRINQDAGTDVAVPTPTKSGYEFVKWNPAVPATMPDADMITYAEWTPRAYTVDFELDGGTLPDGYSNPHIFYIDTIPSVMPKATKDGYVFNGWYASADFSGAAYDAETFAAELLADDDHRITVYAKWTVVISVTITWGDLTFTYTPGGWNPQTHTYGDGIFSEEATESNIITVMNNATSGVAVNASITYQKGENTYAKSIEAQFSIGADGEKLGTAERDGITPGSAVVFYLWLSGRVNDLSQGEFISGTCTVTIDANSG